MVDTISVGEFGKMSLEERAQIVLREISNEVEVEGRLTGKDFIQYYVRAKQLAESKGYLELVGGTPKSGPRYKITDEGYKFMFKKL